MCSHKRLEAREFLWYNMIHTNGFNICVIYGTAAYCERAENTKNYAKEKWAEINDGGMAIFAEFATGTIVVVYDKSK